ncbi:F0F1 ATP synthase subunit B [Psychromarinibacter sp. C21-152]|uniref:ATP synthase subunit b n=1 Tax=Psychromarinibacter sediminicola TaxID=3033385 RepID=A0AAE3T9E8_9RHOB|nr:F0F1 ATP synthase subunit B [Psychromarinibacter sediminicola]MDF0601778.1 F0F1 ATP synthase subunit B [Psychromarinibacter sediminicola]
MRMLTLAAALLTAGPALAATGPFVSLWNTNFVVLIAFLIFVGALVFLGVPRILGNMLDKRADGIRSELDEAKALREEAQTVLASYERKQKEVEEQSARIVENAKEEARAAGEQAKKDLEVSMQRRMAAAEDQIASAQAKAVKEVRDQAVNVAVAAARDVIAKKMTATDANKLIDESISTVEAKLH